MSEMTGREKVLWDELQVAQEKVKELTGAWAVEYRKRMADDEKARIDALVEERLAAQQSAVARG